MWLILIIPAVWFFIRRSESKEWNNGISRKSGKPWVAFDIDSSGATGYCDGSGNIMWK